MSDRSGPVPGTGPGPDATHHDPLALAWEHLLSSGGGPSLGRARLQELTARLTSASRAAMAGADEAVQAGQAIARLLVQARRTGTGTLADAVRLLTVHLHPSTPAGDVLGQLTGSLAGAYLGGVRAMLLEQQEAIHRAAAAARDDAERALRHSEARFRAVFTDAGVGIGIGTMDGQILEVNEAFQRMLGYTEEEFLALPVSGLTHPHDDDRTWQDYADLIAGKIDAFRAEKPYLHKDGHAVWTHLTVSLIRDSSGQPLFQVAVVEDITDRRRLAEELLHAATHDALTGLPNRARFLSELETALADPDPGRAIAVLFLDLDSFKAVNDSRGHLAGDQVLVTVAQRLAAAAAPHGALVCRLAGDEFVALVTSPAAPPGAGQQSRDQQGSDQQGSHQRLADDLLAALVPPIPVTGQQPVHVEASIGVVQLPASEARAEDLLQTADLALHAAKEAGKGQVTMHEPARHARQLSRFRIATDLPGAVDGGELGLVYQPLIRLGTGAVHSAEALLRWHHPQLGEIGPQLFVPVAEETSVITAMGRWVLERAVQDVAASTWPAVNVNLSVRQLWSPAIVDDVRRRLDDAGLAPERLCLEVTESVVMHADATTPIEALHQLAALGVRIVMDDFGTGYNNLAALRRLPLHEVKLAGAFLEGLHPEQPPDEVDTRILATLVELGHALGLIVTAEGVETAEQDRLVRDIGCDVAQGMFYGPPAPVPATAAPAGPVIPAAAGPSVVPGTATTAHRRRTASRMTSGAS